MEARLTSAALVVASILSLGASHRTQNFIITAPTPQFAKQLGDSAETYRRELAIEWLGEELPPWQGPCPITAHVGPHLGAGGATSFMFDNGRPFGWTMTIQGSQERILDSVLPHEITHTIFATHFGRPLPRWADEGACTTVEHATEKDKQKRMLINFLTTGRGIAFNRMFAMKEYPPDILPLYSQGYSLARFLIAQKGRREFVDYVGDGMNRNNWTAATKEHYGYESLSELQVTWLDWVRRGCPPVQPKTTMVAALDRSNSRGSEVPVRTLSHEQPKQNAVRDTAARPDNGPPFDSWYARQRDLGRAGAGRSTPSGDRVAVAGRGSSGPVQHSLVTRPQEIGTPKPTVIQGIADPTSPVAPAGGGQPAMIPIPVHVPVQAPPIPLAQ
jgi:hypothetical protein